MDIPVQDDGLKWFGEGFDGFPKRLPEDCVEYVIHLIDSKLQSASPVRSRLKEILKASNDRTKELLKDYIWQRNAFELKLQAGTSSAQSTNKANEEGATLTRPCLRGRTNFGDSIADEWLVVYLLLQLSKDFADAWIRIYDTDGEFLLIEAANALPKWLSPDIAENRVWINNGHLRIIPPDDGSSAHNMSLQQALRFVQDTPEKLIISPFVEDEAFHRLRDYPSAISSSLHHSLVSIPRKLAYILHRSPSYVSPAVEAFYLRDPISLKPLATKDLSTLHFPPEDFVVNSVRFTRVGFAQLLSQMFEAPPAWTAVSPHAKEPKVDVGMKLTCGFEMLLSDPQNKDKQAVREIGMLLDDVENGEEPLPSDAEIGTWPKTQDEEKWLDIDYNDFEKELSGDKTKSGGKAGEGFGDKGAQENLQKMVSRFEDFLKDDEAGIDGVETKTDDDDDDNESSDDSEYGSDAAPGNAASYNEDDFKRVMQEVKSMQPDFVEESGLLNEARKLALEDAEDSAGEMDEDEEMKKVMELMEKELKGHGALNLGGNKTKSSKRSAAVDVQEHSDPRTGKPTFGPERPPHLQSDGPLVKGKGRAEDIADEDIGRGDEELSSDDEEFNDVDLGLAKNMLESFKGQTGLAGPAGNLMRAMGVNMPRDDGSNG